MVAGGRGFQGFAIGSTSIPPRRGADRGTAAELRIDDSVLMLSDATEGYPAIPSMVHLYVPDVDRVFEKALAAGASELEAPRTHEGESDKRGMVSDPCGTTWVLSTQMAE